ncbi:MAG: PIG-L family deacetylase [Candidatus Promineifilaceae bacterium]
MAIFAHPDDEGAVAGTLAHYAQNDTDIILVCATKGEVGEISDPALATTENLGQVRQKELEEACRIIGIQRLEFLNYRDSGMDGTAENQDTHALIQADTDELSVRLVALIRRFKPDIVITFEPYGWYGHPDHIFISKWVTAAFPLAGNPDAYPEAGPAWQPKRLFYSVMPFSKFKAMIEKGIEAGYLEGNDFGDNIPQEQLLQTEAQITHIFDIGDFFEIRMASMMAHRTQFGEDNFFRKIPKDLLRQAIGREHYIQVFPEPRPSLADHPAADLFDY